MSNLLYQNLYRAYFSARKDKRSKPEVLKFELDYESEIEKLYQDIINQKYTPSPTRVFVTHKPVKREIFAPQFRDRVVHHLIYNYIYQYLDAKFIYDSYSCREGKGTLFGIERAKRFMRKASHNYTRDAYVLKLDIRGYFMNINRGILYDKIIQMIDFRKLNITDTEIQILQYLIKVVSLHNAAIDAIKCSPIHYWEDIPASKSLFCTASNCGLPIGSLTSQLFSNVYMNDIDHQIKACFKYYGRYVDDLLLVDCDKVKLLNIVPWINQQLQKIALRLNPRKIYLQHYTKGFYFLGQYIKPNRTYISNRIKKHFHIYIEQVNKQLKNITTAENSLEILVAIENTLNAYFGLLSKANTHNYVQYMMGKITPTLYEYMELCFVSERNQMKVNLKQDLKLLIAHSP